MVEARFLWVVPPGSLPQELTCLPARASHVRYKIPPIPLGVVLSPEHLKQEQLANRPIARPSH